MEKDKKNSANLGFNHFSSTRLTNCIRLEQSCRVKSGKFGHKVNSNARLQTVEIQMRRLPMSRLIRIFTVCLVNLFFITIIERRNKQGDCPNLAVCPNIPDFTQISSRTRAELKTYWDFRC